MPSREPDPTRTTIGYKRIVDLKEIHTDSLAIVIEDSRVAPAMAFVGVY